MGISSQLKGILLQSFIIFHYSSRPLFGGFALKIEFVVFVYGLYEIILNYFLILGYVANF